MIDARIIASFSDAGAPEIATLGPLADHYRYWRGASRRRYLFSAVECGRLGDFTDAVVIVARRAPGGAFTGVTALVIGTAADAARRALERRLSSTTGLVVFVHLLAKTPADRTSILDDLLGETRSLAA
jgi:hypothetical protein